MTDNEREVINEAISEFIADLEFSLPDREILVDKLTDDLMNLVATLIFSRK